MGILDSIGGAVSSLDPGKLVETTVDKYLPKNMQFVGAAVGALVDYESGNMVGAAKEGMTALSELKDVPQSQPTTGQAAASTTAKPATATAPSTAAKPATTSSSTDASSNKPASSIFSGTPSAAAFKWSYE